MLNEVALLKKRSPMASVGNYFTNSEEQLTDQDFFIVNVSLVDPLTKKLTPISSLLQNMQTSHPNHYTSS